MEAHEAQMDMPSIHPSAPLADADGQSETRLAVALDHALVTDCMITSEGDGAAVRIAEDETVVVIDDAVQVCAEGSAAGSLHNADGEGSDIDPDDSDFWDEPPIPTSEEEENGEDDEEAGAGFFRKRRGMFKHVFLPIAASSGCHLLYFLKRGDQKIGHVKALWE